MSVNETKNTTILAMDVVGYSAKMNEDETSTTEKLKNARVIIEKLVKQESALTFDNYGLGFYYFEVKDFEKMLAIYEAVPTPDFHWWNYNMGVAHHYLGNSSKANEYFSVIKPLYGEDPINTMLEGMKMWNNHIAFQEYIKFELENNYGYN